MQSERPQKAKVFSMRVVWTNSNLLSEVCVCSIPRNWITSSSTSKVKSLHKFSIIAAMSVSSLAKNKQSLTCTPFWGARRDKNLLYFVKIHAILGQWRVFWTIAKVSHLTYRDSSLTWGQSLYSEELQSHVATPQRLLHHHAVQLKQRLWRNLLAWFWGPLQWRAWASFWWWSRKLQVHKSQSSPLLLPVCPLWHRNVLSAFTKPHEDTSLLWMPKYLESLLLP